jgi:hypothetical protein
MGVGAFLTAHRPHDLEERRHGQHRGEERPGVRDHRRDQAREDAKPYKTIDWVKFVRPNGQEALDNLGLYEFKLEFCKVVATRIN